MPFRNSNEKQSSNNVKEEINKKNDERMNDEEFQQFVSIFNERKLSYKHESFHVDDVKRLTGEDRIWASCFFNQKRKSFKNAVDSACKALKWRAERKAADIKQGEIGEELLNSGGMFICGRDKDGSRVFHLVVKKFVRGVAFQDLLVYLLETLQRHECGKSVSFVADCGGARLTSVEMSNIKFVMSALDCYYPNVLKRIYIVDLPWIFNTLWTAVKTWLNEDQRDKVKFIAANKLPKSIPLRHQLNSLDGEKIWSYSCAKLNRGENRGVDCPGEAQSLNKEEAVAKMDRDFQPEPFNNKSPLVADKDNDSPQK